MDWSDNSEFTQREVERAKQLVAANIKKQRKALGIPQDVLGARAGITRSQIQLIERGRTNPRLSTLVQIAQTLGVGVAQLLNDVDNPT
jgi:transcriptional regulator with XRE-family HTH domain